MAKNNKSRPLITATAFILGVLGTVGTLWLFTNISQRKEEAKQTVFQIEKIDENTVDPAIWGKNFPRQYDGYIRTVDIERTKYGGSENIQKLDQDPLLRTIFSGYAFGIDYREERGHAYMLDDQRKTKRVTERIQPGACLNCHASMVSLYPKLGFANGVPNDGNHNQEAIQKGFEVLNKMPYNDATKLVSHPVSCLDCHEPKTMSIRVTRPAFITGIRALANSNDPVPHLPSVERWRKTDQKKPYDPNIDASRQEMRSLVCSQCHVEYYINKNKGSELTYPWKNGLKVEQIESYYNEIGWKDWEHKVSGAHTLKAQHPEFELWSQGIHARSGVACADCHMPYKREGAIKISDHHVRSPMLNISRACQTCHNYPEEEIKSRVETIQNRTKKLLISAEIATVDLINDIKTAKDAGFDVSKAQELQRQAQWRTDFVNAENSMGFHAPQEAARILGEAANLARQGQLLLAKQTKPASNRLKPGSNN